MVASSKLDHVDDFITQLCKLFKKLGRWERSRFGNVQLPRERTFGEIGSLEKVGRRHEHSRIMRQNHSGNLRKVLPLSKRRRLCGLKESPTWGSLLSLLSQIGYIMRKRTNVIYNLVVVTLAFPKTIQASCVQLLPEPFLFYPRVHRNIDEIRTQ